MRRELPEVTQAADNIVDSPTLLCCPRCGAALGAMGASLRCEPCSQHYPVRDEIPSFLDEQYYYGTLERGQAAGLVELARSKGYAGLAADLERRKVKGRKVFLRSFEASFADGRFVLPLTRDSVVLDIGCGFGAIAIPLSKLCRRVVAVDATFERVRFLAERAAHEGIENIEPIHASGLALPLPERFCDAVVFNGVLEWVGEWDESKAPRDVQLAALRHARSRLKPDGRLLVAIENRTALELLYRRKDHNKLYGTSFLPRPVANAATRLLKAKPYRTYTYTHRGYRRLLAEAGFAEPEIFCPWPRYQNPENVIRFGDRASAAYLRKTILWKGNRAEAAAFSLLSKFGLDAAMSPAFLLVAQPS